MKAVELVLWALVFGAFAAAAFTFAMGLVAEMKNNDDLVCFSASWIIATVIIGLILRDKQRGK
jgi:hypothetical protein